MQEGGRQTARHPGEPAMCTFSFSELRQLSHTHIVFREGGGSEGRLQHAEHSQVTSCETDSSS